ncbi:uncharacterized protein LOC114361631 [Ostrinia furnacalis]|uniref:uncharacterized protein LOC114361631 n=1 Tax=Ostrinia furnacalis TaxID=93504 RepID=UPI00103C3DB5|nr:uncharacterized protein LOC114361631 [Ostrinia furnacalis]
MWTIKVLFILVLCNNHIYGSSSDEEPELYYYGIEESERGLPACGARQACGTLLQRYWRPRALLRLCRCRNRARCLAPAPPERTMSLNNHAELQFCSSTTDWPQCGFGETSLVVESDYDRMNPDELEEMHHRNIQLTPPNITVNCQCLQPYYWKLKAKSEGTRSYQCGFLPVCRTGEFCGNVTSDLYALYQSCLCPRHHICVHNGGVVYHDISEILYEGQGWKAYCQKVNDTDSYEDY